jgi:hypothetical protein
MDRGTACYRFADESRGEEEVVVEVCGMVQGMKARFERSMEAVYARPEMVSNSTER